MKKCLLVLILLSCVYLDSVNQPSSVAVNERFTISINGNYNSHTFAGGYPWLALMLPEGFLIDSIRYDAYAGSDTLSYVVTQPDSDLSAYIESSYPCDSNMRWYGYSGEYVSTYPESIGTYIATVHALATESTIPGTYLVDYLSGSPGFVWPGIVDSLFDQPMIVTGAVTAEIVERHSGKGFALWPTIFKNTLNIFTDNADQVEIFSEDGRLVKSFRLTPDALRTTLSWDGRDDQNRMLGSGIYFVKFIVGDYEETEKVLLIR
jgi:hypothetical protein